ncbi:MAG TPA: SpoIIIAH-like family protein [Bacillales bacterium]|nr:SpoIIIAH-like family protein [Bacillales bacterium]
MLKKQTVWLLTMLSLIIVLSVYYMTSPTPPSSNQMAVSDHQQKDQKKSDTKKKETSKADQQQASEQASAAQGNETVTTNITGAATFAAAKMKKMDARSQKEDQLRLTIASDSASAKDKAQARDQLEQLNHLSSKEQMLESLIVAKGFGHDALVNVNGDQIRIYVEANSLSNKQAAQILDLVEGKLDMATPNVYVTYKPGKAE